MVTNAAGQSVWTALWQPFGGIQWITGPLTYDARLPGQWFQLETGLHRNGHRQYDPTTGGYLQPDPLGLRTLLSDGPNVYAYAGSSPLVRRDPTGLFCVPCVVAVVVGLDYFYSTESANAPGPGDAIVPHDPLNPLKAAAIASIGGALVAAAPLFCPVAAEVAAAAGDDAAAGVASQTLKI